MKRLLYLLALTLVMASCSNDGNQFKIEGHLLGLNQGEFYVYSTDGLIQAVDTIHVKGGRFEYSVDCKSPGTLVILLPNFSEIPVFVEPGGKVEIEGSASRVKEIKVKGTDENELMGSFREHVQSMSPPETAKFAVTFIKDNPKSIVSVYLLNKYFLQGQTPDYDKALSLIAVLRKAQPNNGRLVNMEKSIKNYSATIVGKQIKPFTATDINGKEISLENYKKGDAVIYTFSSWEYESQNLQRTLKDLNNTRDDTIYMLGISLDASVKDCKRLVEREKVNTPVVCDGNGLDGKLTLQLGLQSIPDNIVLKDGKVVARSMSVNDLRERFKKNQ